MEHEAHERAPPRGPSPGACGDPRVAPPAMRPAPDLHVRACGLAHEGRDGRGFCSAAARAGNLACAHTMARFRLKTALEDRLAAGAPGAEAALARWQALDLAVGRADHARSEAEKTGDRAGIAAATAAHDAAAAGLADLLAQASLTPRRPGSPPGSPPPSGSAR